MASNRAILLISDRPDRSAALSLRLRDIGQCQAIGLNDPASAAASVTGVVTDVDFHRRGDVDRLRKLLSKPRAAAAPIVAILRHHTQQERLQAAAVGATSMLPADATVAKLAAALALVKKSTIPRSEAAPAPEPPASAASITPAQHVEQARQQFGTIFDAAAHGGPISRKGVDSTTSSIMDTIADGGIRQWLEIVWSYDDATYQHCLLVTGLAAEFAANLHFGLNDRKHLIRGALLHDVGKAKIPLAILNKPGALTPEELAVMRTHAGIGYDLLRQQADYEPELLEVVLRHHEMLDGSGYPDGIAGKQINDLVRLVTICDIYAALIERRPYKQPMTPAQAYKILQDMEGKLEGPLVKAFAQVAEKSGTPGRAQ